MNALTLRGRDLADGGRGVEVTLREGLIASIDVTDEVGPDEPWIGPGLVDLQVNGYGEGDANAAEPHPEQIHAMCRSLAQRGVSQFLPTVITASPEAIVQRIAVIAEASRAAASMGMVAGIHVEGPFLSPEDGPRGVHPLEHVRPPSISEIGGWLEAGRGMVRIVTLSPHHSGTEAAIDFLVSNDVRVAIGHTHANDQQIASAVDAGATLSTHLGNGAHSMLPRHPNYLWSQLAESRLAAGLIADGHHLPDSTLAAMLAAKRRHGAFLVSDSVATPPDLVTDGHSTVGGQGLGRSRWRAEACRDWISRRLDSGT